MSNTDITAFRDLPESLQFLNLLYNQITDISPPGQNPHLGQGDEIHLSNNPLSTISIDEYIPQLEARGVKITYEYYSCALTTHSKGPQEASSFEPDSFPKVAPFPSQPHCSENLKFAKLDRWTHESLTAYQVVDNSGQSFSSIVRAVITKGLQ